ncbi:MAG: UDP-N-acetylglucosamine--N-acetylmuramyl-(pentapeptide) pyrophosphoryl-undecaprenol N-acetylglucosamine transferase [Chloroflexi bacterium]|nr:UDP-N-acetylglucosamine--N-acetylmuramyl-(pentapeptide) pyrophosphoryl-undecaprenol N-acetylglucosamine transferase [Chloroflexota bacterium]
MRLALCGGGTGGHVYPALSIAAALERELDDEGSGLEMLYLGSSGGAENDMVARAGMPFRGVSSGPIRGRSPWELVTNSARIGVGVWQARAALRHFAPDVILSTGGYASFPVAVAARARKLPLVLYLPDVYPGWAVQAIVRLAQRVAVTTVQTLRKLPDGKGRVTGYPVREEFWRADRSVGRKRLGLDAEEKVLFVAGASQGAHSINEALASNLRALLELCEVVHISGHKDEGQLQAVRDSLPDDLAKRYHLFAYMHDEIPWAMAAADLAVCRAGASVLGELPAVGLPAVLIPYQYAGGHQRLNARHLEDNGAAVILDDSELQRGLLPLVGELLSDEGRLRKMSEASRRLARPEAARDIARLLLEVASGQ